VRSSSVLLLVFGLAACGSSSGPDFSSAVTACRSLASAVCNKEAVCNPPVNIDTCTQLQGQNCDEAGCVSGTFYNATAAQTCYNAYVNQSCADSNADVVPASCQPPLPCTSD
jgi:hypothetical protein